MSRLYTPEDALERLHPKLIALIDHQKMVCGCAMKAVRAVAQRIGTSEQWVRRITGRYGKVKIQAHQFINVAREHVRLRRRRKRANASVERNATLRAEALSVRS
jgi:hypothetical protein